MTIYIVVFALICICWIFLYQDPNRDVSLLEKRYCIFLALVFVTIAALRGLSVGTDTRGYYYDYLHLDSYSFENILELYDDNPGYYVLAKVFFDRGASVQVWFGIVALMYVGSVSKLIVRFSKNITMSYIMFLALGFYSFSLADLKQTVAMAIALYAFNFLYDKKYIRFFICVGLSTYFHMSSIIFIFAFVVAVMKRNRYIYMLLTLVFSIVIFNASSILGGAIEVLGNEHYANYLNSTAEYSPTTFVVFLAILIFSFMFLKNYTEDDMKESVMMYSMTYLGVITLLFSFVVASAFRLALYFTIFSIILLPNAISYEEDSRLRKIMYFVVSAVCILYFVYVNRNGGSIVPYEFYWNEIEG